MIDYQWPSMRPDVFDARGVAARADAADVAAIEGFFSRRLSVYTILMPSARSAIALLLQAHGINRSHTVFVPRWSSHCLWDVVARHADPTFHPAPTPDVIIGVHKWARVERLSRSRRALLIEDSVDSIFVGDSGLFPNKGSFEILSLPKILGTFAGGLILTRDRKAARELGSLRRPNPRFARFQSYLKTLAKRGEVHPNYPFLEWSSLEYRNLSLDRITCRAIRENLENYDRNLSIIRQRLDILAKHPVLDRLMRPYGDRLPPVIPVPLALLDAVPPDEFMIRHWNGSGLLDQPDYVPVCLLPVHFGITASTFDRLSCWCMDHARQNPSAAGAAASRPRKRTRDA